MQIDSSQMAYNSLDFTIKTSSGDTISLNMYDNRSFEYSASKTRNSQVEELSLTHAYGYEFSYKGDGIDAKDQEEIKQAIEALKPKIDAFIDNVQNSSIPTPKEILNKAFEFKQELPVPKDNNHKNAISQNLLEAFDQSLQKSKIDQEAFESVQSLFEKVLEQLESFSLYV